MFCVSQVSIRLLQVVSLALQANFVRLPMLWQATRLKVWSVRLEPTLLVVKLNVIFALLVTNAPPLMSNRQPVEVALTKLVVTQIVNSVQ